MSYFEPLSFWETDAFFSSVDVAIVGGGIVGMNAALRLKTIDHSLRITILDRASIGTAASSRNAGFACYGSPSEIYADLQSMPEDAVIDLVKRRVNGLKLLRETVGDKALHYEKTGGHEVFLDEA